MAAEGDDGELPSVDHGPLNEGPWEKAEISLVANINSVDYQPQFIVMGGLPCNEIWNQVNYKTISAVVEVSILTNFMKYT